MAIYLGVTRGAFLSYAVTATGRRHARHMWSEYLRMREGNSPRRDAIRL